MANYLEENTKRAEKIMGQMKRSSFKTRTIQMGEMSGAIDDMVAACEMVGLKVTAERAFNISVTL